jgi:hypothetical protein
MIIPTPSKGRLLAALITLALVLPQLSAIPIWINEIHYSNASSDIGEFVEIAGAAGTDLSGHTLLFYNGSNGSVYTPSVLLTGILPDLSNGYGTLSFSRSGIQNGSPDGVVLIGPDNFFIQFLSYEGSFLAVGGAANGQLSQDIGVTETDSALAGHSLQLTGIGSTYTDFTWAGPAIDSPGSINTRQTFTTESVPDNAESIPDSAATIGLLVIALSSLGISRRFALFQSVD